MRVLRFQEKGDQLLGQRDSDRFQTPWLIALDTFPRDKHRQHIKLALDAHQCFIFQSLALQNPFPTFLDLSVAQKPRMAKF